MFLCDRIIIAESGPAWTGYTILPDSIFFHSRVFAGAAVAESKSIHTDPCSPRTWPDAAR
jgi:hypothetical protein